MANLRQNQARQLWLTQTELIRLQERFQANTSTMYLFALLAKQRTALLLLWKLRSSIH